MSESAQATFAVNVEGNAPAAMREVSASSKEAYAAISKYESDIKSLSSELKRLKGTSDEVKAAKSQIKERVDAAKSAVSALAQSLIRSGSSYGQVANAIKGESDAKKKSTEETGRFAMALGIVSPRLANAHGLIQSVKKSSEDAEGGLSGMRLGAIGAGAGVAVLAAASIAAVVAVGSLAASTIRFGLASSAAADRAQRQRQAILGSADDARALGTQIDALAGKVATPKDEIQALGVELARTRLTGKAMVDTMNAVTQASAAAGNESGNKLKEIITRGQNMGRIGIGRLELQGTGLDLDDVAREYAAGTKKSVSAARSELLQGRAGIESGAAALAKAAEKKFGSMNLSAAFDFESAPKKFAERFGQLASGIKFDALSKQLGGLYQQLDPKSPLGSAVSTIVTTLGQGLVDAAAKSIPALTEGMKWVAVGGLKLMTTFYEVRNAIRKAFDPESGVGLGQAIMTGIGKGMLGAAGAAHTAIKGVMKSLIQAGKDALESRSPSRAFERLGVTAPQGLAVGAKKETPVAERAAITMVDRVKAATVSAGIGRPAPANDIFAAAAGRGVTRAKRGPGGSSSEDAMGAPSMRGMMPGAGVGSSAVHVVERGDTYHFYFQGGGDGRVVKEPTVLEGITRAIRAARNSRAAGVAA